MKNRRLQLGVLLVLLVLFGGLVWKHQAVLDWWHLRGYNPPATVSRLASDDTMTAEARHLFYVNRPDITTGPAFTSHCPAGSEKTVVLGCYVGDDQGIYIYAVSDPRLNGVEQVTAAHEMLHAAYRRLSSSERSKVDTLLLDYYEHDLTDSRIKATIAAYQKSEPHDVVNEMHSVFGTEIANLPAPLEAYYRQYFTDRGKIAAYTASYQSEFTGRQMQVAAYDTQLSELKDRIDTSESQLNQQQAALSTQKQQLQADQAAGQVAAYNSGVPGYNQAVRSYNGLLATAKDLINQYNVIVAERNALVLEEQQLTNELSANALPATP